MKPAATSKFERSKIEQNFVCAFEDFRRAVWDQRQKWSTAVTRFKCKIGEHSPEARTLEIQRGLTITTFLDYPCRHCGDILSGPPPRSFETEIKLFLPSSSRAMRKYTIRRAAKP